MIKRCPQHGLFRGEHCECGSSGQLLLDDAKTEQLGRLVAGCLRHFPADLGLPMDGRGWVDLNKLCQVVASRHRWADRELIVALVSSDSKHRYEIRGDKVRLGIDAPKDVSVHRREVYEAIQSQKAAPVTPDATK